jgi:SM-20-related protein
VSAPQPPTVVNDTDAQRVELAAIQITEGIASQGWAVCDGFVSVADVRLLATEAEQMFAAGDFHTATTGAHRSGQPDLDVRRDEIRWLDLGEGSASQRRCASAMETLRITLNQGLFLGLLDLDVHFAIYEPGAFYKTHHDRPDTAAHRTVSCVLYLNEGWGDEDGGELRLYLEGADVAPWVDVEPYGGRLVCFLSERFSHEVLVAKRRRVSLTGWFGAALSSSMLVGCRFSAR